MAWSLTLALTLFAPLLPACEVESVTLSPAGAGVARLVVGVRGETQVRQQRNGNLLVLFVEGCGADPGSHRLATVQRPVRALRWSHHPETDSVWVVVELDPAASVALDRGEGVIEVTLTASAAPVRRWPIGFRVIDPLPADLRRIMVRSWRPDCPVHLDELSLVQVTHLGYDGREHQGDLIVNRALADEVVDIFAELIAGRCPIERVRLVDFYADDLASMADNNTSAFNCRPVTGNSDRYSVHSHGRAIDLNPLQNPYVKGAEVLPPAGRAYLDRVQPLPGLIRRGDACHRPFASRGWRWGGDFRTLKDYQHFEKPAP